jgi:hypothetical protein
MRKLLPLAAVLMFTFGATTGCDDSTAPASQVFEIHVQGGFDRTWVYFELDGQRLLNGNLTTDETIGLATIVQASASPGLHTTRVLADLAEQTAQFELRSYQYVLVRRVPEDGALQIVVTNERPIYE